MDRPARRRRVRETGRVQVKEVRHRLAEFDDIVEENGGLTEEEREERDALETLEPSEDMASFHNYIDTHIWIDAKEKVDAYTKYMQKALDHFCEMTGFEISY